MKSTEGLSFLFLHVIFWNSFHLFQLWILTRVLFVSYLIMKAFDYSTVLHVWFLCLAPSLAVRLDQLVMFLCILSYTRNKMHGNSIKSHGKKPGSVFSYYNFCSRYIMYCEYGFVFSCIGFCVARWFANLLISS